jgi:hypothetical protein
VHDRDDPQDRLEERALAAAIRSDDADDLAALDAGIRPAQDDLVLIGDGHVANDETLAVRRSRPSFGQIAH